MNQSPPLLIVVDRFFFFEGRLPVRPGPRCGLGRAVPSGAGCLRARWQLQGGRVVQAAVADGHAL